ncbi:MAG: L,D-transpeptidase family protein [Colwellia sp.]
MKKNYIKTSLYTLFMLSLFTKSIYATEYAWPADNSRLIGEIKSHKVTKGDFFQELAEQYNVGFLSLISANPGVDPFLPKEGTNLTLPTAMLLPYGKREGIVINLPELRLYYFPPAHDKVYVFPVGIGREGLETPAMTTFVSDKRENPIWRPTEAMKARYFKEKGKHLANEIPPGKNNPFGKYALRLGFSVYLIHGTNQRFGVGMRASSGCIRMYDDDIKWLFDNIDINTSVKIVNQPVKMSYEAGSKRLIEVHSSLAEHKTNELPSSVQGFLGKDKQDTILMSKLFKSPKGLVVEL